MRLRTIALLLSIAIISGGCAGIIDAMIPKAPHSDANAPEVVCVWFPDAPREILPASLLAVVAPIAIGFAVDQVSKGLEAEAKRYKASYSGRASSYLLKVSQATGQTMTPASPAPPPSAPGTPATLPPPQSTPVPPPSPLSKVELLHQKMRIDRYHGDVSKAHGCPANLSGPERKLADAIKAERTMGFEAEMELSSNLDAIRITPTVFELKDTKAKVSIFNQNVDVNVQVTLSTLVKENKDGAAKQADIAQIDFPVGKLKLSDDIKPPSLSQLRSSWYAVPRLTLPPPPDDPSKFAVVGPLNLTITVMESNDFGDVIGQGAKLVSDNKTKIVDELLKALGLKKGEKKDEKKANP